MSSFYFLCQALRNLSVKSGRGSLPSSVVNPDPEFRIQGYALNLEREKFKRLEGNKFLFKEILFFLQQLDENNGTERLFI